MWLSRPGESAARWRDSAAWRIWRGQITPRFLIAVLWQGMPTPLLRSFLEEGVRYVREAFPLAGQLAGGAGAEAEKWRSAPEPVTAAAVTAGRAPGRR